MEQRLELRRERRRCQRPKAKAIREGGGLARYAFSLSRALWRARVCPKQTLAASEWGGVSDEKKRRPIVK